MVDQNQTTASRYVAVNTLVETVGLSITKACRKVGLNHNTYYKHREKVLREKQKAGASDKTTGTTHVETSTADHSQDTASAVSANN